MPSIDIIQSAEIAYKKTWAERHYLLPMLILPLLIKYFFFTVASIAVEGENFLRMSLIMLPSYFAEGWLLAHWVRTIVMGHRWPFRPTGDDKADIKSLKLRGRGVLSGAVCFTIIHMAIAGYFAFFMSYIPVDMKPEDADPSVAIVGMTMLVATVMLFRFVWFYIPLSVNTPPRLFLKVVKPISVTFQLLGLWLVCAVPAVVMLQFLSGLFSGVEGESNLIVDNISVLIRITIDMIKNLIATAGLTIAIMTLLGLKQKS